jgi:hypothetical protein
METTQRVIHRNRIIYFSLVALSILSLVLLGYAIFRENLSPQTISKWPWKLQILDIQSATTLMFGAIGSALARAQYSYSIRPALGWFGRVAAGVAPNEKLSWVSHVINGGQGTAVVFELHYHVLLADPLNEEPIGDSAFWVNSKGAIDLIETCGLTDRDDFNLEFIARGRPIAPTALMFVGWFTEEAMREIRDIFVRIRVTDQLGDMHERVISLLKGANRTPIDVDAPPF